MTSRSLRSLWARAVLASCGCWLALQSSALAHHLPPGFEEPDEFDTKAAMTGFLHPFTGLDHLFVALVVGWMAWQWGRKAGLLVALLFGAGLATGAAMDRSGVSLPLMEPALALSVSACGLALLMRKPPQLPAVLLCVAAAGIWHGGAHAAELKGASGGYMTASFLAGTAALTAMGCGLAALLPRSFPRSQRFASASLIVFGLALCALRLA